MKRTFFPLLLILAVVLYACGNNDKTAEDGESFEGFISNAEIPPRTMDGKPVLSEEERAEAKAKEAEEGGETVDTDAYSDSKGVGKFTDFELDADGIDDNMASTGQELFQNSCTACHTTTDKKLVGPGLKGITEIRTGAWILNMIHDPITMTKEDPVAIQLKKEMNGMQMTSMGLDDDEIRAVYEYLRKNDA